MTTVHFVVPDGIDDLDRPSGGNTYDRLLRRELRALGWSVCEHPVPGFWSSPDAGALAELHRTVERIADDAVVLVDGLVASAAPEALVPHAQRLRLVVLVHMPFADRVDREGGPDPVRTREGEVLCAATAVVATSEWSRARLLELYRLGPERVHVAVPAVDPAELADGSATGGSLLCVATVAREKGHDVLVDALASVADLTWECVCVGRVDRDPGFVEAVRRRAQHAGVGDRVRFPGARSGADLDRSYSAADLMVLASRAETFGIVVIEALARGVPVLATDVGGVSEALGWSSDGVRPGLLVPPGKPGALAGALREWLGDPDLRTRLRAAARERRGSLPAGSTTASAVADVLAGAAR